MTAALVISALMMGSCVPFDKARDDGTVTVVLAPTPDNVKVYTLSYKSEEITKGFISILDLLKAEGKIDYELNGTLLNRVCDANDEAACVGNDYTTGTYIWLYTSVQKDISIASLFEVEYDGKTLKSSDLGAAQMTVEDGAVFYIGHIVWG